MAMHNVDIYDPDNPFAKEWHDKYFEYRRHTKHLSELHARLYAWRHEPDTWFMVFITLGVVCGTGQAYWWIGLIVGGAIGCYWPWAYFRKERVIRLYDKLRRKRAILRVPKFLYEAINAEAGKRGLSDWSEWPTRRFKLVGDLLLEESALLRELWNDCGCEGSCKHTNRLPTPERKGIRGVLREKAALKLGAVAAAHRGALEANDLRIENLRRMLEQERGPQVPKPKKRRKKEEE